MEIKAELDLQTLALANFALTKRLFTYITAKQLLDDDELQALFQAAAEDILRSTLPVGPEQAKQALSLFWSGFEMSEADSVQ